MRKPDLSRCLFVAWNAMVGGEVFLDEQTSVWFSATIRGDMAPIRIGRGSNVQDGAVIHVDLDTPTRIGDYVTIGHGTIVHGCTVGDRCILGMGAILLNNCEIAADSIVGAGALVTKRMKFPPRSLIVGSPARRVREVTDKELMRIRENAEHYINGARQAREQFGRGE